MFNDLPFATRKRIATFFIFFLSVMSVYMVAKLVNEVKASQYIGTGVKPGNTIDITGKGEVFAVPDIATVTYTIQADGTTALDAQKIVTDKSNKAADFLKQSGVEEKDIKTTNYSTNPRYEYPTYPPCVDRICPDSIKEPKIIGYQVSENVTVKVRKADDAGKIIEGLTKIAVTNLYGPEFSIDDEDALKAEARKKAIEDAKGKAEALANDLGVKIGRVVSYSESSDGYPIYYGKAMMDAAGSTASVPPSPGLSKGENKITSNITITYEIK